MKLAEALQERASLNKAIHQLNDTICDNVLYQDGTQPDLDINALLSELSRDVQQLRHLITRINLTNAHATTPDGMTMTELLANRDTLKLQYDTYTNIQRQLALRSSRASRSEILILSSIPASDIKKMIDDTSKQLRLLENQIQSLNWQIDLDE